MSDASFIYVPELGSAVAAGRGRVGVRSEHASEGHRLALLSLWAIPGVGPKALEQIRSLAQGDLSGLLEESPRAWVHVLPRGMQARVGCVEKLRHIGEATLERAQRATICICYRGEDAYPPRLLEIEDAPPLLFYRGQVGPPRRRLAMVGSRHPDNGFLPFARRFACAVAEGGVGIISGAAQGVDRVCHLGAVDASGETWAFVGSGLDQLDPAPAALEPTVLSAGGVFFSEMPPGARANPTTFPRRNRLISGAADAVLVLRAAAQSGALITARKALEQGRPLLALPGDAGNPAAYGCNALIRVGNARLIFEPKDAWEAVRFDPSRALTPSVGAPPAGGPPLSDEARSAYEALRTTPLAFEDVLAATEIAADALTSALCELELRGLVVQYPGKRYERI